MPEGEVFHKMDVQFLVASLPIYFREKVYTFNSKTFPQDPTHSARKMGRKMVIELTAASDAFAARGNHSVFCISYFFFSGINRGRGHTLSRSW